MTTETTIRITASHIAYLLVCHRKLWLYANGVEMEHFSELVQEGRLIHETAYPRRPSQYVELQLDGIKIDFFDPKNRVVHETKRGRAVEQAHRAQVQFYLYKLWEHGFGAASGKIEYPDLRRTETVEPLTDADFQKIETWETETREIITRDRCPTVVEKPFCRSCSYHDLCYVGSD